MRDELAPAELAAVRDHLRSGPCPECDEGLATADEALLNPALERVLDAGLRLTAEHADPEVLEPGLVAVLEQVGVRRARARRRWAGALALAAAVVLCVAVAWRLTSPPEPAGGMRLKGAAGAEPGVRQLDLLTERPDGTWKALDEDASIRPGAVLVFRVTTTHPVGFALVEESAGGCEVLLPDARPEVGTHRLEVAGEPFAVRLAGPPGPRTFRAVSVGEPGPKREPCRRAGVGRTVQLE